MFIKKALGSYEEYSYCGRSLSIGFVLFTYLGTWIGGGTIIGLAGRSYEYGANQYWIMALSCIVELFFALFFISRIRNMGLKSITDFFCICYPDHGGSIKIPATVALLIRNVTMIAMQFSALSYLITLTFGINRNLALLLIYIVIIGYTVLSGLWGVVMTDIFQGILQTFSLIALVVISLKSAGGISGIEKFYEISGNDSFLNMFSTDMRWYEIILYIIAFGAFFLMNDQANWERIYASKNSSVAKWGFMIPLVITLMSLVSISYLGVFQKAIMNENGNSQSVIYEFILNMAESEWVFIILVGIIAAIMSSADSFLLSSGVMVTENIIKSFVRKNAGDNEQILYTRAFVVVTGAIAFAFAINIDDILSLWLTGIGFASIILLPGYLLGWRNNKKTTGSILAGMTVGGAYIMLMIMDIIEMDAFYVCIGILMNILTVVIVDMKKKLA